MSRMSRVVRRSSVLCESLEARQLLSAGGSATLSGGILTVEGTRFADEIVVKQYKGNNGKMRIRVTNHGELLGTFFGRAVTGVQVSGGAGADTLRAAPAGSKLSFPTGQPVY